MGTEIDIASFFSKFLPFMLFGVLVFGIVEDYFFIRKTGKLKRGLMIWKKDLRDDEWLFLSNLREDILDEITVGHWPKKKSFIAVADGEALIRFDDPKMRTAWPMVGYVDLSSVERNLEFRMPVFMLLLMVCLVLYGMFGQVYYFGFLVLFLFAIAFYMQFVGLRDYLAKQTDLHFDQEALRKRSSIQNSL